SREMEFFTEKELRMQIGFSKEKWPVAMVKELVDNSLDACESANIVPKIKIDYGEDWFSVEDNGPGIPHQVIKKSLDYMKRVSDKNYYVSPTRGQLGNALKCVWAAPFVADGESGKVEVITGNRHYVINVKLDKIAQKPEIRLETNENGIVKNGTFCKIHWRELASYQSTAKYYNFYNFDELIRNMALFNPHARFRLNDKVWEPSCSDWKKHKTNTPTSPHWYNVDSLAQLIAAYITKDKTKKVREFVSEFQGLTHSAKQKTVAEMAGLSGACLNDLVLNGELNLDKVRDLLEAMQFHSKSFKAKNLGIIGEDHWRKYFIDNNYYPDSIYCKRICGDAENLPFIVEAAFGVSNDDYKQTRDTFIGINWSAALGNPFSNNSFYENMLDDNYIEYYDPTCLILHLVYPGVTFTDRGKSHISLPDEIEEAFEKCVRLICKDWAKFKKKRHREMKRIEREDKKAFRKTKKEDDSLKAAAFEVMEQAYMKASSENKLPANARQIMYAARPLVQDIAGDIWKNSSYFTQNILIEFLERNPELTENWDVVYDARGNLIEPHSGTKIPIGTLAVREYIYEWHNFIGREITLDGLSRIISTCGPDNRYRYVLFVEKEGFWELLNEASLQVRYDIALMSTKGMSSTASRKLVQELTKKGVTIFVLHDFDKAGFSILNTLRSNTQRFKFDVEPNVIDMGLRLEDALEMDLSTEMVKYKGKKDPKENIMQNGATEEEANYLVKGKNENGKWYGDRIELNMMTSRQFVDFIEKKLAEHGVEKFVPSENVLQDAFLQQYKMVEIQDMIRKLAGKSHDVQVPENLYGTVKKKICGSSMSWDEVVYKMAADMSKRN
ncbi:DUF2399 domain-containing protein, partial [candidate division KSB1 bacterium]|nr:DUF2399 domain-containing protein [candidate division KSB1 bacterium]